MDTEILKNCDLSLAIACLKNGEPVVFPTETVYGLGAPIFSEDTVKRVFEIKGRPLDNPLIAHIASLEEARCLSDHLDPVFYTLAEHFWPGPLTIVVQRKAEVPALVSAGQPTIAIRMPLHPIARNLIKGVGQPLVAPSANLSGRPSPTRLIDVLEDLQGKVKYVIDGGDCELGIESTVISLFHSQPTLLRPGQITREALEDILGRKVAHPQVSGPIFSPGMKYRHYAPKAQVRLVYQKEELRGPYIQPDARSLYAQLREADRSGAIEIQIYCDQAMQKDEALMNRLLRAAGQIV
jgi:L-threonylcarbamoyladenylate synthase